MSEVPLYWPQVPHRPTSGVGPYVGVTPVASYAPTVGHICAGLRIHKKLPASPLPDGRSRQATDSAHHQFTSQTAPIIFTELLSAETSY